MEAGGLRAVASAKRELEGGKRFFPPFFILDGQERSSHGFAHARDFLDCVKSRKKPVGDIETGYYSSLPALLAIHAIRDRRTFKYDVNAHMAVAV